VEISTVVANMLKNFFWTCGDWLVVCENNVREPKTGDVNKASEREKDDPKICVSSS